MGLRDLLLTGIGYSLAIVLLAIGGVGPGMASWLAIPTAEYFLLGAVLHPSGHLPYGLARRRGDAVARPLARRNRLL